jgi:aminoglycoside phosphotransferase (APT) family kinase protein
MSVEEAPRLDCGVGDRRPPIGPGGWEGAMWWKDELDSRAIVATLGLPAVSAIEPVGGGWDTALWRVESAGTRYAVRVFRVDQAATCHREVLAMTAAARGGVPVPEIHAETVWNDHPVLLLSWVRGRPLLDEIRARPWRIHRLGVTFGKMHARIHRVPAPEAMREDHADWITWMGPGEEALKQRLQEQSLRWNALLHLDYHPLNVMFDGDRVTGVLDWANSRAGDPRADLARTISELRLAPEPPHVRPHAVVRFLRRTLERAWRQGYDEAAGPFADLEVFYAWAGVLMTHNFGAKMGNPGVWLDQHDLDRINRWAAECKRRAGISA